MFHDRSFVHIGGRYVENIMNMDLEIHDVVPSGINVCMTLNVQSRLIFIYTEQFMLGCVSLLCSCHISKKNHILFSSFSILTPTYPGLSPTIRASNNNIIFCPDPSNIAYTYFHFPVFCSSSIQFSSGL